MQTAPPLDEREVMQILRSVTEALDFIHSKDMVHRDVKPSNILLADNGSVKLSDLGLARAITAATTASVGGTLFYMAPEVMAGGTVDPKADIWALGRTAVQLASGQAPLGITTTGAHVDALVASTPAQFTDEVRNFVRQAMQIDPTQRPTAAELLQASLQLHSVVLDVGSLGSVADMKAFVRNSAWMVPSKMNDLQWQDEGGAGVGHTVRTCDVTNPATAAETSARESFLTLVCGVEGNTDFAVRYDMHKVVLSQCRARAMMHAGKAMELQQRYTNQAALCSLDDLMQRGTIEERDARARTKRWFLDNYPSLDSNLPNVRVWIAFHAPPSEDVARQIVINQFIRLQRLDAGYYAQGFYFTFDSQYALEEYGQPDADGWVALVVCAVVVGNFLPIVERPWNRDRPKTDANKNPNGYLGKAIDGRADAHVVRVATDPAVTGDGDPLPCPPDRWGAVPTNTEIVVKDEAQLLPLGYLMVRRRPVVMAI